MSRIVYLVGVDGSEWSDRAAQRAITIAQKTGAEVHFITAIPYTTTPHLEKPKVEELERKSFLDPLIERFADSGVKNKGEMFWGHPVEVIHERAKKDHVNMIFVGRRGRSKIANLVLGSVANSLAHTAGVPIVLVP